MSLSHCNFFLPLIHVSYVSRLLYLHVFVLFLLCIHGYSHTSSKADTTLAFLNEFSFSVPEFKFILSVYTTFYIFMFEFQSVQLCLAYISGFPQYWLVKLCLDQIRFLVHIIFYSVYFILMLYSTWKAYWYDYIPNY